MKLFIPIFKDLPIDSGFRIQNIGIARKMSQPPDLLCQIWKDFEVLDSKKISFEGDQTRCLFLSELFSQPALQSGGMATLEFITQDLSPDDQFQLQQGLIEAELVLKAQGSQVTSSVLYDLIADKKKGHHYAPILHSAHAADVGPHWDSIALLINFRPPYLKTQKKSQSMDLLIKSAEGILLQSKTIEIPFNSTYQLSFREQFAPWGNFHPGSQLNFKGGESQFALFTLFWNPTRQAIGLEHSLPPIYYSSGAREPSSRKIFYENAFSKMEMKH